MILPLSGVAFAEDALELTPFHRAADGVLGAVVKNRSTRPVHLTSVSFEIDGRSHTIPVGESLPVSGQRKIVLSYPAPRLPGTYAVVTSADYIMNGIKLSMKAPGLFHHLRQAVSLSTSGLIDAEIGARGEIVLVTGKPEPWRLVLPEGLRTLSASDQKGKKVFHLSRRGEINPGPYPVYAIAERVEKSIHFAEIVRGSVTVGALKAFTPYRGRLPGPFLLLQALVFLVITRVLLSRRENFGRVSAAFIKYSSRMFLLMICYYSLKNADLAVQAAADLATGGLLQEFFDGTLDLLRGHNYENFFMYFIDPYWAACLILCFPYLYFLEPDKPVGEDKYASLVTSLLSVSDLFRKGRTPHWNRAGLTGLMTILVKLFFIPLLVSWAISNALYQKELLLGFSWDLIALNAYLVALFLYLDTLIYSVGYLLESARLDNEIRSVEPTVLGWVVCLWCYPPFNRYSFRIFDLDSVRMAVDYPHWVIIAMTCIITALWGVFMWSSLALGFKASNLTNRGIVTKGPYRFVRHPAYAAKLLIWTIQGIFFAQFGIGIMLGFIFIYILRAWTEERHLAADPDYRTYLEQVPWRFVPGVV